MSTGWMVVFVLCGALVAGYGVQLMREARSCADWPSVEGRVVRSAVAEIERRDGRAVKFAPDVAYAYTVAGKPYEGTRVTLVIENFSGRQSATQVIAAYSAGASVRVFHNPTDPAASVLVPRATGREWLYVLGGVIFCAVGFVSWLRR